MLHLLILYEIDLMTPRATGLSSYLYSSSEAHLLTSGRCQHDPCTDVNPKNWKVHYFHRYSRFVECFLINLMIIMYF